MECSTEYIQKTYPSAVEQSSLPLLMYGAVAQCIPNSERLVYSPLSVRLQTSVYS